MKFLFINLLNMSIVAGWLILAVIIFRLAFKKAPRWIVGVLWCLVGFRLLCPFSVSAPFSIIPSTNTFVMESSSVKVNSGLDVMDTALNSYLAQAYEVVDEIEVSNRERMINSTAVSVMLCVWMVGIFALLIGSLISYWRLHKRLEDAVRYENNIFQTERIDSPFVIGIFCPKIYVPYYLGAEQLKYVILHEKTHIRRGDHIIKPIAYLLLSVYWFNPLVWVAFILLCRDIELACDEKVIRDIGFDKKKLYSETLLKCSVPQKILLSCPIAFAEVSVKERILNIMKLKKLNKFVVAGALLTVGLVAIFFTTNPVNASENRQLSTPIVAYRETGTAEGTGEDVVALEENQAVATKVEAMENAASEVQENVASEVQENAEQTADGLSDTTEAVDNQDNNAAIVDNQDNTATAVDNQDNTAAAVDNQDNTVAAVDNQDNTAAAQGNVTAIKLTFPVTQYWFTALAFSDQHKAVDYVAPEGAILVAAISGTVTATGFDAANGNYIVITSADGWSVYYNHCASVDVAADSFVNAGDAIGTMGSTGKSTGPHLDFAISDSNGIFYDPAQLY